MAYKCKSKALEIYFNNCRLGHTCVFHETFLCYASLAHLFPFLLHVVCTENMDEASGKSEWAGELELGNTINPTLCVQSSFAILPLLDSLARFSGIPKMGPWSLGLKGWDTKLIHKEWALFISDPGTAEGFKENFNVLKLVLDAVSPSEVAESSQILPMHWRVLTTSDESVSGVPSNYWLG